MDALSLCRSSDLGYLSGGQIGSNLPPIPLGQQRVNSQDVPYYLRTRVEGRYHYGAKIGNGYGGLLRWEHGYLGDGKALAYSMKNERIFPSGSSSYRNKKGDRAFTTRSATAVDAEHQFNDGSLSLYGRYVSIPDADPLEPGESPSASNQKPANVFAPITCMNIWRQTWPHAKDLPWPIPVHCSAPSLTTRAPPPRFKRK